MTDSHSEHPPGQPPGPLPRLVLLTDRRLAAGAGHDLCPVLEAAVEAGVRCVLLREREMHPARRAQTARSLRRLLDGVAGTMLIASGPADWAHGVHLSQADPLPGARPGILGRSCHDAAEVAAAAEAGVDYVFVSPVFETPSKPGYGPPLGPEGLAELSSASPVPVYALGGITASTISACLDAGAAGVAVMGTVMAASEPGSVAARLAAETDAWRSP